ncbi:Zinc knuckle family protein [Aphelenchoides avenae]|nr:Zinc knuckle family protein [Aphelenchus avenae]
MAATTDWSKMEQGTDASGDDDSFLSRRQTLCTTDTRSKGETTRSSQNSSESNCAGDVSTSREWTWPLCPRSIEEVSSQGTWTQPTISRFDSDAVSTAVPTSASSTAVLVECVKTYASASPSIAADRLDVVAFFDSGSSGSYITRDLMNRLHLQPHRQRTLTMNTFGHTASRSIDATDTTVTLWTSDSRPLSLDVIAMETIASSVNTTLIDELDLPLLWRNELPIRPTRIAPDILIGQDNIHLFQRQQLPALPHGFAVTTTRLGIVIGGAGRTFLDSSEVALASARPSSPAPLAGHQRRVYNLPHFYRVQDVMEANTSRLPTRLPAHSAGRRTELPMPHASGPTDSQNAEIHEEDCFLCSLLEEDAVHEETQPTVRLSTCRRRNYYH